MSTTDRPRALWRRLADEPLAQFFALGLVIFAVDRLTATEVADPRRIVVDDRAYAELVREFAAVEGRAPSVEEMTRLADRWSMNETLYREARALRLDEGDEMVRERVMQKLRVLMHGAVTVETPDEATLRSYFEENRALYRRPELVTLRLAQVDGPREAAEAMAARLNAAERGETTLAPGEANVLPLRDRPRPALEQVLGTETVAAALALPRGVWAPLETARGWQAALLEGVTPALDAEFEALRGALEAEWRDIELRRAARRAVDALMASYEIERAPYDPAAFEAAVAEATAAAQGQGAPER